MTVRRPAMWTASCCGVMLIEGRTLRGSSVTHLTDPPMPWSDQRVALGLAAPPAN
jgi:hypothetical protein